MSDPLDHKDKQKNSEPSDSEPVDPSSEADSPAENPPQPSLIGACLGPYRLQQKLGQGGMGQAFLAVDTREAEAEASWVVKTTLAPESADIERERFVHSAKLQSRLCLPGVAVVRDYGLEGSRPYLVMPHDRERRSLKELLEAKGQLSWSALLPLFRSLLAALSSIHQRGLIHRDIKPSNILVRESGAERWQPLLIDFGIVKDLKATESLTETNRAPGFSPEYGAPELHRSSGSARSDLYSLGVTMLFALTGRALPAKGPNDFEGVSVPRALDRVIRRLTDPDPEARPESAEAVLKDLDGLEDNPWPTLLLFLGVIALLALAAVMVKKRLDAAALKLEKQRQTLISVRAELKVATDDLAALRARLPKPRVSKKAKPSPLAEALKRYELVRQADRKFWSGSVDNQGLDRQREQWRDLEQQSAVVCVQDAARAWRVFYDALLLRRQYVLTVEAIRKPIQVGTGPLYFDLSSGESSVRVQGLKGEVKDGVLHIDVPEDSEGLSGSWVGRAELRFKLYEDKFFDATHITDSLTFQLPLSPKVWTDGERMELKGADGLVLTVRLRRA